SSVEWIAASCSLAPPSATGAPGTSHHVTATVLRSGVPASGTTVFFGISTGPNSGQGGAEITNGAGQATFTYQSNGVLGTDNIRALGTIDNAADFECTATMTWSDTSCDLQPPTSTSQAGGSHTVTLTLTSQGNPAIGASANFLVTAGPNQGQSG